MSSTPNAPIRLFIASATSEQLKSFNISDREGSGCSITWRSYNKFDLVQHAQKGAVYICFSDLTFRNIRGLGQVIPCDCAPWSPVSVRLICSTLVPMQEVYQLGALSTYECECDMFNTVVTMMQKNCSVAQDVINLIYTHHSTVLTGTGDNRGQGWTGDNRGQGTQGWTGDNRGQGWTESRPACSQCSQKSGYGRCLQPPADCHRRRYPCSPEFSMGCNCYAMKSTAFPTMDCYQGKNVPCQNLHSYQMPTAQNAPGNPNPCQNTHGHQMMTPVANTSGNPNPCQNTHGHQVANTLGNPNPCQNTHGHQVANTLGNPNPCQNSHGPQIMTPVANTSGNPNPCQNQHGHQILQSSITSIPSIQEKPNPCQNSHGHHMTSSVESTHVNSNPCQNPCSHHQGRCWEGWGGYSAGWFECRRAQEELQQREWELQQQHQMMLEQQQQQQQQQQDEWAMQQQRLSGARNSGLADGEWEDPEGQGRSSGIRDNTDSNLGSDDARKDGGSRSFDSIEKGQGGGKGQGQKQSGEDGAGFGGSTGNKRKRKSKNKKIVLKEKFDDPNLERMRQELERHRKCAEMIKKKELEEERKRKQLQEKMIEECLKEERRKLEEEFEVMWQARLRAERRSACIEKRDKVKATNYSKNKQKSKPVR